MAKVVLRRSDELDVSIRKGLAQIERPPALGSVAHVVVNPNLGNPFHVEGVTTHVEVLSPIVEWLRDKYPDVAVVESDGIRYSCKQAFETMGLTSLMPRLGARLVNLSEDRFLQEPLVAHKSLTVPIPKTLADADLVVSVPVLKSHELTTVSLAVKNLFGCVPTSTRIRLHPILDEVLASLCHQLQPEIIVGDGLTVMEGNGPIRGETRQLSMLTFSGSALVHDAVIAHLLYGIHWTRIRHLALAQSLLQEDLDHVEILNEYGTTPLLRVPNLDLVARTMASTYKNQQLTELLYLSPLFGVLNRVAWGYRAVFGRKPKFQLHY